MNLHHQRRTNLTRVFISQYATFPPAVLQDTPGRERYYSNRQHYQTDAASLGDTFFRKADAVMLVYDMTSSTSFTQLLKWYADLMDLFQNNPLPILIVANKLDLFSADQRRPSTLVNPRKVPQRVVLGLGDFRGKDFRYEYQVSPKDSGSSSTKNPNQAPQRRMEISTFLANRENWTTDGSYLESLLNSEDASHPDREMVLLWCMRNGLQHVEVSAATGEHVDEAIEALVRLALLSKQKKENNQRADNTGLPVPSSARSSIPDAPTRRNERLDLHQRYAPDDECTFLRPLTQLFKR
jgi:GTPase SAR1 family protein